MTGKAASTTCRPINVLVVDDHEIARIGLVHLLNRLPCISVCGELRDGAAVLKTIGELQPDIVLMDIELQKHDGLSLTQMIRMKCPGVKVIILSMHQEQEYGRKALCCGANGFVSKDEPANKLISAIRAVTRGELFFSQKIKENILHSLPSPNKPAPAPVADLLSNRERQVFDLVGRGHTTREIAERLCLSVKTVDTHRARIKLKLGIDTRVGLVLAAGEWVERNKPRNKRRYS